MKTSLTLLAVIFAMLSCHNFVQAQTLAAGSGHSFFLCSDNVPVAWGYNVSGQLGDGSTTSTLTDPPVQVSSLTGVVKMAGGGYHSLFLKDDSTVWACGSNAAGQLGDGTTTDKITPIQVSGLTGITAIAGGGDMSLFLKSNGTVWSCGSNGAGQLGDGTTTQRTTPVQVTSLSGIIAIAAGPDGGSTHSLFLKNDGTVWACGKNLFGQLGDGTTTQRNTPVQVTSLSGITAIEAGMYHSLFLKSDGTVWATGRNSKGQLGDGSTTQRNTPVQVSAVTDITALAAGQEHSLFRKNDGTAWACGWNIVGQLGDGSGTNRTTPVHITSLSNVTSVASGVGHSLFLKNDGTVWACGSNGNGELGDGTTTASYSPVAVIGLCAVTPSCTAPIGLREVNVQDVSARLVWDTISGAIAYKVLYKVAGSPTWTNVVFRQHNQGMYNVTGLTPGTVYRWAVMANCGSGTWSPLSATGRFVTLAAPCLVPSGLSTSGITLVQARANWNVEANANFYRIRWREQGTGSWSQTAKGAAVDHLWITGLAAGTTYEWQIKTVCGGAQSSGTPWSALQVFSTPSPFVWFNEPQPMRMLEANFTTEIFPNPAADQFALRLHSETQDGRVTLQVRNAMGQVMLNKQASLNNTETVDASNWPSGVYFVTVQSGQQVDVKRVAVQH